MEKSVLKNTNFGHIEAEADMNLIKYFLETESYKRILFENKMYVIGRKGTGKSAIYLTLQKIKFDWLRVSGLDFHDYHWQIHNKIKDESNSADFAFVNTWKFIILLELAKLAIKDHDELGYSGDDLDELKQFLQSSYGSLNPSFKEYLVDKAKRIKTIELPSLLWKKGGALGKIDIEDKLPPEKKLMSSINILNEALKEKVFNILLDKKRYFIMFDKLDDGWDGTADFKSSMIGLLRASRDINLEAQRIGKKVKCVPFLRSDIYDTLSYNDKNKAYPDIESLSWTPENLRAIISKRIAFYTGLDEKIAWSAIFDNQLLARNTTNFNYMIKRTLLRPRDIIEFCDCAKAEAVKNIHEKILNQDIYNGEEQYSEYIYREFIDEADKHHAELPKLFEVLRGLNYERFTYEEFSKKFNLSSCKEAMNATDALRLLFDYSIVGVQRIGGTKGGSTFEYKYADPLIQPEFKSEMIIHPSLKKHLKLREKRGKNPKR